MATALDMRDIADRLGVGYWRVRRWRENAIKGVANSIQLPDPDVCQEPPRWTTDVVDAFAVEFKIRSSRQQECPECHRKIDTYSVQGTIRPHGWTTRLDSNDLVPCPGSFKMPVEAVSSPAMMGGP